MLKVAFAGQTAHADDPARVLAGLNRALAVNLRSISSPLPMFRDLVKFQLRYAGAGHPPLLMVARPTGKTPASESQEVEANG